MTWTAIALLLLVSFLFSGIEAGILSINRVRLRHRARLRESAALRLEALLKEPERLLLTVVIVTNLCNIFAITLATRAMVRSWGGWGYLAAFLIFLPVALFGLELFPKSLFRRFPYRALALLSQPLRLADLVLSPLLKAGISLARRIAPEDEMRQPGKLFGAREDLKYFTIESERAGALSPVERTLIHNVVDFRAITAREVMRPLSDFPTLPNSATVDELLAASRDGEARVLLVAAEDGEIVGIVNLFDALMDQGTRGRVSSLTRAVATVPAQEPAPRMLKRLRGARTPVLLVLEEGKPAGLVFRDTLYRRLLTA